MWVHSQSSAGLKSVNAAISRLSTRPSVTESARPGTIWVLVWPATLGLRPLATVDDHGLAPDADAGRATAPAQQGGIAAASRQVARSAIDMGAAPQAVDRIRPIVFARDAAGRSGAPNPGRRSTCRRWSSGWSGRGDRRGSAAGRPWSGRRLWGRSACQRSAAPVPDGIRHHHPGKAGQKPVVHRNPFPAKAPTTARQRPPAMPPVFPRRGAFAIRRPWNCRSTPSCQT